jgi:hypothetical protein
MLPVERLQKVICTNAEMEDDSSNIKNIGRGWFFLGQV